MDQDTSAVLKVGAAELQSTLAKLAKGMAGKEVLETAKHQLKKNLLSKGGQVAALNLERQAALLAARKDGMEYWGCSWGRLLVSRLFLHHTFLIFTRKLLSIFLTATM